MKYLWLLLVIIGTDAFAQDFEVLEFADSLVIRDENIATNSFSFGDNPLAQLRKLKPSVEKKLFENNHVEGKIDTIHDMAIDQDRFSVFEAGKEDNFLITAEIVTKNFKTKHGIVVGLRKSAVINLLKSYNLKKLPDCLVLENSEIYEYLIIRFRNGLVSKITFHGCYD